MNRKFFPTDKNYILQEVQNELRSELLHHLVEFVKRYYLKNHNPLGLIDDSIERIKNCEDYAVSMLDEFYDDLAVIYRFQFAEVQLEFLFDGTSHYDKYHKEWQEFFKTSVKEYCLNDHFVKAVLEITVFHPVGHRALLAGNRMKYFLEHFFELKVYKYRGVQKIKLQAQAS